MLPESTILGHLRIIEIYEFYNKPVLFACQNKTGHIYLAVWLDETNEQEVWLYVPVSPKRFERIRNGMIDLHDAFMKPEDGIVLQIAMNKNPSDLADIRLISAEELDETFAPIPGDYLLVPDELPRILWEDIDQRNITMRPIIDEQLLFSVS